VVLASTGPSVQRLVRLLGPPDGIDLERW